MQFTVIVAENSHYMDESENYELGTFDTLDGAIAASKRIVDEYLTSSYRTGVTAKELFENYVRFGEDPYIVASEVEGVPFSAWDYAKQRCETLCTAKAK